MEEPHEPGPGPEPVLGATLNGSPSTSAEPSTSGGALGALPALQKRIPFFNRPAPLERKQSSSDLLSRLKTRKILGVGETDNGDIHRSKLSQVLGHNEHLYIKFPRGYGLFHSGLALVASIAGLMHLLMPNRWQLMCFPYSPPGTPLTARCYGAALLGVSAVLWRLWGTIDKAVARALVVGVGVTQALQAVVLLVHLPDWWSEGGFVRSSFYLLLQGTVSAACYYYYYAIGAATSGMRRAHSHKDIPTCNTSNTPATPSKKSL